MNISRWKLLVFALGVAVTTAGAILIIVGFLGPGIIVVSPGVVLAYLASELILHAHSPNDGAADHHQVTLSFFALIRGGGRLLLLLVAIVGLLALLGWADKQDDPWVRDSIFVGVELALLVGAYIAYRRYYPTQLRWYWAGLGFVLAWKLFLE